MFGRDEALRPKDKIKSFLRRKTKTHDRDKIRVSKWATPECRTQFERF
jgi:hypothetical protein